MQSGVEDRYAGTEITHIKHDAIGGRAEYDVEGGDQGGEELDHHAGEEGAAGGDQVCVVQWPVNRQHPVHLLQDDIESQYRPVEQTQPLDRRTCE